MHQAAALPFRHVDEGDGTVEILLVTSSANRWIIPKGDIDDGMEPHRAAEKEAFEEGGVRGRIDPRCLGKFGTRKDQDGASVPIDVEVFPLEVHEELDRWPEMGSRQRRWLPGNDAAEAIKEPELAAIIRSFRP